VDLDQVLSARPSRRDAAPPWPLVQEGKLVLRNGARYIRVDGDTSGALIGPAQGGDAAIAGDSVTFVTPQTGVPVIVFPATGAVDVDIEATASAVTLPPGSPANVVVTEPSDNLFDFDFGIPAGTPGAPGAQGPAGAQGPQGIQGPTGAQGVKGDTGAQGPQGIKGDTGLQGPQGVKGDTGLQGPQGVKGDTGSQGPQGVKGDIGPQGPQGVKGDTGAQGAQGTQGAQGPKGDKGDTGAAGPQGVPGPNVMPAPDYDSGWVLVNANANNFYPFNHGLALADVPRAYQIWFSPDGARWFPIWYGMGTDIGVTAASPYHNPSRIEFSTTQLILNVYAGLPLFQTFISGAWTTWFTGYYRVRIWR
jgi:hypothetical protein